MGQTRLQTLRYKCLLDGIVSVSPWVSWNIIAVHDFIAESINYFPSSSYTLPQVATSHDRRRFATQMSCHGFTKHSIWQSSEGQADPKSRHLKFYRSFGRQGLLTVGCGAPAAAVLLSASPAGCFPITESLFFSLLQSTFLQVALVLLKMEKPMVPMLP